MVISHGESDNKIGSFAFEDMKQVHGFFYILFIYFIYKYFLYFFKCMTIKRKDEKTLAQLENKSTGNTCVFTR